MTSLQVRPTQSLIIISSLPIIIIMLLCSKFEGNRATIVQITNMTFLVYF